MGYEFEVEVWTLVGDQKDGETSIEDYRWNTAYSGDDKDKAFATLDACKKAGAGCARITWR
jgi:hypothetical protein